MALIWQDDLAHFISSPLDVGLHGWSENRVDAEMEC